MKFDAQGRLVPAAGGLTHFTGAPEEDEVLEADEAPE
jgi:hypothetical protein